MTKSLKFRVEAADEDVVVTLDGAWSDIAGMVPGSNCSMYEETVALQSTTCTFLLVLGSSPMQRRKS